jgi:hypothetical protein
VGGFFYATCPFMRGGAAFKQLPKGEFNAAYNGTFVNWPIQYRGRAKSALRRR